jgi:hypothetical protein
MPVALQEVRRNHRVKWAESGRQKVEEIYEGDGVLRKHCERSPIDGK